MNAGRRLMVAVLILVPSLGLALPYPPSLPPVGTACTYEGIFPGQQKVGRWTYHFVAPERYEIRLQPPTLLGGIFARRLGKNSQFVEGSLEGSERQVGALSQGFERLRAVLMVGGQRVTLTNSVHSQGSCEGFPREVKVGDEWSCRSQVKDTWDVKGELPDMPTGTELIRKVVHYKYLRDEEVNTANGDGKVTLAVIELRSEGMHRRMWMDPALPWCAVRQERLKLDMVVGTDTRVEVTVSSPEPKPKPDVASERGLRVMPVWLWWLLGAMLGIALLVFIFTKNRPRSV